MRRWPRARLPTCRHWSARAKPGWSKRNRARNRFQQGGINGEGDDNESPEKGKRESCQGGEGRRQGRAQVQEEDRQEGSWQRSRRAVEAGRSSAGRGIARGRRHCRGRRTRRGRSVKQEEEGFEQGGE